VKIQAAPRFLKSIPAGHETEILLAMRAAVTTFGQPHLHAGLGLRRIPPFMECRCGLELRLIFQRERDALVFHFCGTHDEVRTFLKNRR
jgi:hypothetical protein